jgi:hypothetical protein
MSKNELPLREQLDSHRGPPSRGENIQSTRASRMSSVGNGQTGRCVLAILSVALAAIVGAQPVNADTTKLLQMLPTVPADLADRSSNLPVGGRNDPQFAVTVGRGVTLPNPPEYYAINAIEVDEEGGENNPCFLRLWGNMVDPSFSKNAKDRRLLAKYELPTCGSALPSLDLEQTGFQPSQSRFIRGVKMCRHVHGDGGYELKGLGVVAGEVVAGSTKVTPRDPEGHNFKRANCPDHPVTGSVGHPISEDSGWTGWSECMGLEKELVVGVSLYIHGKYFSGMTVLCKTLTAAWGPTPIKDGDGY